MLQSRGNECFAKEARLRDLAWFEELLDGDVSSELSVARHDHAAYAASAIARSAPIPTGIQGFLYDIRTSFIAFMFMFNPELILHGVHSWTQAILIFVMALAGMSAFECFAQGWCVTRNRWYDIPLFLAAAYTLLHPGGVAALLHLDEGSKYYLFIPGLLIYAAVWCIQRFRIRC